MKIDDNRIHIERREIKLVTWRHGLRHQSFCWRKDRLR